MITEPAANRPQFTGVLTPDGEPIFRFYMPKPGLGFLAEGIEDFDPDAFMYATNPEFSITQEGDEEEEESEVEEE